MNAPAPARFTDEALDDIRTKRVGRARPRKQHTVQLCACGAQAWVHANKQSVIMVSADDRRLLRDFWWDIRWNGRAAYAYSPTAKRHIGVSDQLHTIITGADLTDHADRNGLNNMRGNIRPSSKALNGANTPSRKRWPYKGIRRDPRPLAMPWEARISVSSRPVSLGRFATAEDAARAYDDAARKAYGSHARLNFPNAGEARA